MGKALVIKNANFSDNKLDTVDILEQVPCTSILLSESTITVNNIGDTVVLTATVQPADTTDTVIWSSDNANIATVENGTVKVFGIGTATITAKCGDKTATATVSQPSIRFNDLKFIADRYPSSAESAVYLYTANSAWTIGSKYYVADDNLRLVNGATNGIQLFVVPYGASTIKAHTINGAATVSCRLLVGDCVHLATYQGAEYVTYESTTSSTNFVNAQSVTPGKAIIFRGNADYSEVVDYFEFE